MVFSHTINMIFMRIRSSSGFTLIELSIVLVIIGLIIGSVLMGKDLIKAAEIRATTQQIEKYSTAVNTFRIKYGGLPGDLKAADAARLGFFNTGMTGGGQGDSNGLIQSANSAANPDQPDPYGEGLILWRQLSEAKMIEGNYGKDLTVNGVPPTEQTVAQMGLWMPTSKIGRGSIVVTSINGKNYYEIYTGLSDSGWFALYTIANPNAYTIAPALSPLDAKSIDQKIDDGLPASGIARAANGDNNLYLGVYPSLSEHCTSGSTPDNYNVGATYAGTIVCNLLLEIK